MAWHNLSKPLSPSQSLSIPTSLIALAPRLVTAPPTEPKRSFLFPSPRELSIPLLMAVAATAFTVSPPPGMAWHNLSKPLSPSQSLSIPTSLIALAPRLVTAPPTGPKEASYCLSGHGLDLEKRATDTCPSSLRLS